MRIGLLNWLVFFPALGALLLSVVSAEAVNLLRRAAVAVSLVTFALALRAWSLFDAANGDFQLVEKAAWVPRLGVSYFVGIDGISSHKVAADFSPSC